MPTLFAHVTQFSAAVARTTGCVIGRRGTRNDSPRRLKLMPSSRPCAVVIGLHPTALGVIRALTREGVACIALFDNDQSPAAATRLCRRKVQCRVKEPAELLRTLEALAAEFAERP